MTIRAPLITPPPRRRAPQQQQVVCNLLLTTLAPVVQAPFSRTDWPNPRVAARTLQPQVFSDLLQTTLAPAIAQAPFNQGEWPNPVCARPSMGRHVLYGISYFPEADPPSTIKLDFQNPVIQRKVQQPQIFPNLVLGPLFVAPGVPFRQQEWPNPTVPRRQARQDGAAGVRFRQLAPGPVLLGNIPNLSAGYDTGTHQYELGDYFSGATSYAIDPAVEVGWTFNTTTGQLEIDTDAEGTFGPYIVTASAGDTTPSNAFTVKVSVSTIRPYRGIRGGGGLRNYS